MTPERIKELLDPQDGYRELRTEAARVLQPGPWEHHLVLSHACSPCYRCTKCKMKTYLNQDNQSPCSIPDPDTRPLEVIAAELVKGCEEHKLVSSIWCVGPDWAGAFHQTECAAWKWFARYATPAQQIVCCLVAMEATK